MRPTFRSQTKQIPVRSPHSYQLRLGDVFISFAEDHGSSLVELLGIVQASLQRHGSSRAWQFVGMGRQLRRFLLITDQTYIYSLQLTKKISHVITWVRAANCEIDEIATWNPLERIHRNKGLDAEICAKSDLEPFQYHTMNLRYELGICLSKMYTDWYGFLV